MLNDITIGQYFPTDSVIHKLDPRLKLTATILLIVLIFLAGNVVSLAFVTAAVIGLARVTRISAKAYLRTLKAVLPVILLTALLNVFYTRGEQILFSFWIFTATGEGLLRAVYTAVRILLMITVSAMLTYTTSPTDLAAALELQLSFLKIIGLQNAVHTLSMMMTIALRFIPTLLEETDKIMNAQKARGAELDTGNLLERVRAMLPILIPLLVSAVRRAVELAYAMESRCYVGGEGRTRLRVIVFTAKDRAAAGLLGTFCAAVLLLQYLLPRFLPLPF